MIHLYDTEAPGGHTYCGEKEAGTAHPEVATCKNCLTLYRLRLQNRGQEEQRRSELKKRKRGWET